MNDFGDCLDFSHACSDWKGWPALYRAAFPSMVAMVDHRADGEHQRAGIDRSITLANSKQILVDEKVRGTNQITGRVYDDIAMEVWSDTARKSPGWATKAIRADYVAYLIAPIGRCYLLPVIQMQMAWTRNAEKWTAQYGKREARNRGYVTTFVPVPPGVLFPAIGAALRIEFEPFEPSRKEAA